MFLFSSAQAFLRCVKVVGESLAGRPGQGAGRSWRVYSLLLLKENYRRIGDTVAQCFQPLHDGGTPLSSREKRLSRGLGPP